MRLVFAEEAWTDYLYWHQTDKKLVERIHELIKDTLRSPFKGIGKPEPLRHALAGFWSRRINDEHRMVYKVEAGSLMIAQLRYHYGK
jgi:toxin YoeB